jgi:hypothetical protein
VTEFFIPDGPGRAGEDAYQRLRKETESRMGRPPSRRRIMEVWTRRGNLDCITKVGAPDPISGDIVTAIFDMGPHQPFVIYRQQAGMTPEECCEIIGSSAYSVSEFTT